VRKVAKESLMLVSDIMTANPVTVGPNDTLRVAIAQMHANECHRLPVVNRDGALIGIVTDRDTRLALHSPYTLHERWEDDALLDNIKVRVCMTPAPITVEPTMSIAEAIRLMITHRIGGLPVLRGETVVGIITSTDVMTAFVRYLQRDTKDPPTEKSAPLEALTRR
jgi:acetoin utilization protein AcuB